MQGSLDSVVDWYVSGWAWDPQQPSQFLCLDLIVNGKSVGVVQADRFRLDLLRAGIGDGFHAFRFRIPPGYRVQDCQVSVQERLSRIELQGSPANNIVATFDALSVPSARYQYYPSLKIDPNNINNGHLE